MAVSVKVPRVMPDGMWICQSGVGTVLPRKAYRLNSLTSPALLSKPFRTTNMALHIFSCPECSAPMEVAAQHAGQSRECSECKALVEIPTLGKLKQLPSTEKFSTRTQPRRQRNLRSWLFSGGLLVAALMAAGGIALQTYAKTLYSDVGKFKQSFEAITSDSIDAMKDYEVLEWWMEMNARDLGEWKEHPGVGYNVQSKILTNIAYGMYAFGGLGLLCLLSSFMIGRPVR